MNRRLPALSWVVLLLTCAVLPLAVSCSSIPADPDGTLERVSGGTLRVGVSNAPPFAEVNDTGGPSGSEADLVRKFAESLGAEVEFSESGEEILMERLAEGDLDLVIGGLSESSPWTDKAAFTRPYAEVTDDYGTTRRLVMAAPLGENAFLVRLERFLDQNGQDNG